ncbi:AsmA family protein [Piscirickettsia litoralis]|uniref:AsmA domain-containing protein n=1 Tax=Piscirickettsia litoralis TaxID=1891921 RepID=A0ABX3A7D6_9GAMM|nr:hypothetical protein [Piscirickettsia litoralis]ODN43345.1 hypothetical protein BGC07_10930 [Piscirickettsia litoralis]
MSRGEKRIFYGFVILILLLIVGGYFLFSHMDSILRSAVEKIGSETTATTVKLGSLKTSLKEGQVSLGNFTMSNPAGYDSGNVVSFKSVLVSLDPNTATKQTIVLNKVVIKNPYILYEMKGNSSNLQQIQKNIENYFSSKKQGDKARTNRNENAGQQEGAKAAAKEQKKFIIKDLEILEGQVKVISPLLKSKEKTVPLPNIRLTNIGSGGPGLSPDQITQQIMNVLVANSGKAAARAGLNQVEDKLKEKAGGLFEEPIAVIVLLFLYSFLIIHALFYNSRRGGNYFPFQFFFKK